MDIDGFIRDLEFMLFSEESSDSLTEIEIDRNRLADVIARIAVFMGEEGASAAKDKLMGYYSAIQDLGQGITHPIFRASTRIGTPPPSSEVWRSRATVAIALDYFLEAKISFDEAFNKIRKVPNIQSLIRRGSDLKPSVRNWHENLDNGSVKNVVALERWKASRENLAQFDNLDEISRNARLCLEAERMLQVAADEIALIVFPHDAV